MDWSHPLTIILAQHAVGRLFAPPREDLSRQVDRIRQHVAALEQALTRQPAAGAPQASASPVSAAAPASPRSIATSCLACARAHLRAVEAALRRAGKEAGSTPLRSPEAIRIRGRFWAVSALLKEALRFAREDGMHHPEVRSRLDQAAQEVLVLERYELSPERTAGLPPGDRRALEATLPQLRRLRQQLSQGLSGVEDLAAAAAQAGRIGQSLSPNPWLHFAGEELAALLAYDLSPDNLVRSAPEERARVEPLIRELQALHAKVMTAHDPSDAVQLAEEARSIRERMEA